MPRVPANVRLGKAGKTWWRWAWSTPQAAAWDVGSVQAVARRASLEDDLATIGEVESLDALDALSASEALPDELRTLIRKLAALSTGRLQILKAMTDLDDRLGLSPKAAAALRWKFVEPESAEGGEKPKLTVVEGPDPRSLLGA